MLGSVDPSEARKQERAEQASTRDMFAALTDDLLTKLKVENRTEKTLAKVKWLLDFALATLGHRPIASIKPFGILAVLQKLEKRGCYHSAHRLRSTISSVFRIAIATDRAETDPTAALRDALVA